MATISDEKEPKNPTSASKLSTLFLSTLRILLTGVAIPIAVSLVTSFYVNTHLLKPKLTADYSWAEVMVMPVQSRPNEYIAALVDVFPGFEAPLPEGTTSLESIHTPLAVSGGEIVSAKKLRFRSDRDYVIDSPAESSRIMKIMLLNEGFTTAHHIGLGLHFLEGTVCRDIVPSPNVQVSTQVFTGVGVNPTFAKVSVDRLGPSEKATLTVSCVPTHSVKTASVDSPFIKIHENVRYEPILYLNCEEGNAVISPKMISWKEASKWEAANFPNVATGFWASRIHSKNGASPVIEDMKELQIDYELVDDTGKHTGNGTWKLNPLR